MTEERCPYCGATLQPIGQGKGRAFWCSSGCGRVLSPSEIEGEGRAGAGGRQRRAQQTPAPARQTPERCNPGSSGAVTRRGPPLRRRGTCAMCGQEFERAPGAIFCGPRCKVAAHRLRTRFERRRLEKAISAAIVERGDLAEAQRIISQAWPPSLRPGLQKHLARVQRQQERFQQLMANLEHIVQHGLQQGAGFPRRRPRIPRDQ